MVARGKGGRGGVGKTGEKQWEIQAFCAWSFLCGRVSKNNLFNRVKAIQTVFFFLSFGSLCTYKEFVHYLSCWMYW